MNHVFARIVISICIVAASAFQNALLAEHSHHAGPDAPVGVMDSHIHPEGGWMVSYSAMQMKMKGNLDATRRVSVPLSGYMASPLSMDMTMHMLGVMYGYSENVTIMAMLPVQSYSMDHMVNMNGNLFTTESSAAGDLKLSMLFKTSDHWLSRAGLNIPTGSIDEKDIIPASNGKAVQLPYPMQPGSGSVDLTAGITYIGNNAQNSWGTQVSVVVRVNENARDYRLGNQIELNSWYSYGLTRQSSVSIRIKLQNWENISGADSALNPAAVPTADPELRAGTRADILLGYNYKLNSDLLIGVEAGAPVYQSLDGPQLETDLIMQLGVQYSL